jgi:3-hydroxybutyryl-CoA dehydratase
MRRRRFGQDVIDRYAEVSGDRNPLHVDPAFAAGTPYDGTIAHGLLVAAYTAQELAEPGPDGAFIPYAVEVIFVSPVAEGSDVIVRRTDGEWHAEVDGRTAVVVRRTVVEGDQSWLAPR